VLAGMYRKQISKADVDSAMAETGIPEKARAEQIEVAGLVELANRLYQRVNSSQDEKQGV